MFNIFLLCDVILYEASCCVATDVCLVLSMTHEIKGFFLVYTKRAATTNDESIDGTWLTEFGEFIHDIPKHVFWGFFYFISSLLHKTRHDDNYPNLGNGRAGL